MPKTMEEHAVYWDERYWAEYRKHFPVVHKVNPVRVARPTPAASSPTVFIGHTYAEIDTMLNTYYEAGGKRERGNKRNQILYSDLTAYFFILKNKGIKLPRRHLAAKACLPELRDLLIKHGYIESTITIDKLTGKSAGSVVLRQEIHHKLERPFVRIASHMPP
jgi:hypothetical protein